MIVQGEENFPRKSNPFPDSCSIKSTQHNKSSLGCWEMGYPDAGSLPVIQRRLTAKSVCCISRGKEKNSPCSTFMDVKSIKSRFFAIAVVDLHFLLSEASQLANCKHRNDQLSITLMSPLPP